MQDSIEPVKILLTDIKHRLKLKDKPFSVFSAVSESDMKELWLELEQIDQSLLFNEKHRKKDLPNFPQLVQFLSHCCQVRHYSFTIKKCGVSSCSLCRPVQIPREAFDTLSFLPDNGPVQRVRNVEACVQQVQANHSRKGNPKPSPGRIHLYLWSCAVRPRTW